MAFILSMYVLTSNNVFTKNQILQLICDLNEQVSDFLKRYLMPLTWKKHHTDDNERDKFVALN